MGLLRFLVYPEELLRDWPEVHRALYQRIRRPHLSDPRRDARQRRHLPASAFRQRQAARPLARSELRPPGPEHDVAPRTG